MLLTPDQLHEIRQIIQDHHDAFIATAISPDAIAPEILAKLKEKGLVGAEINSIEDSYIYGQMIAIMENPTVANMSFNEFKNYLSKNPVPLTTVEKQAIKMAEMNGAQYCKGLGNRVNLATGDVLIEADAALRAQMESTIKNKTMENIAKRESIKKLKSDLGWATKDWARDWTRIAITEKNNAMQHGVADHYRKRYGEDVLVSKRPMDDACFRAGTLVITRNGKIPIEQLSVGTEVLTHKMRWRKITHVFKRDYNGLLYGFNNNKPNATGNHPFLVNLNWRRADSVKRGDYLVDISTVLEAQNNPTQTPQKNFFSDIPSANSTSSVPISPIQLNSYLQMRDSNIDVEFTDSQFKNGRKVCKFLVSQQTVGGSRAKSVLSSFCYFTASFVSLRFFMGFSGVFSKLSSFLYSHSFKPSVVALGLCGEGNTPLFKSAFDCTPHDSEMTSQRPQRMFSGSPKFEQFMFGNMFFTVHPRKLTPHVGKVNTIVKEHFTGVVYNLEVEQDESYVADGFAVHNCKHCKKAYLGPDGQPRIFKLSTLETNGTNVGRKANDFMPVVGVMHPRCVCAVIRIPAGWGYNEEGELVPGGELGVHYESKEDLSLAMLQEADLQKAFRIHHQLDFQGLPIAIENPKNSKRKWKSENGEMGETLMRVAYGYIKRTNGTDEDEIDVFVGPDPRAAMVYVIEQQNPHTGQYDEQKCMIGFSNQQLAESCYQEHFDRPDFKVTCNPMDMDAFKRWIQFTEPKTGEMMKSVTRLVIPLKKAATLDSTQGAITSPAGNRAPSQRGTASNYLFSPELLDEKKKKKKDKSILEDGYSPSTEELLEDEPQEPIKRDKEVYLFQEPVRAEPKPVVIPENWGESNEEVRAGAKKRKKEHIDRYVKNLGRPRNMAEVAKAMRQPVTEGV